MKTYLCVFELVQRKMKSLTSLIFAIFIIAAVACGDEQATEYTQDIDINTILNDKNWVEVTDTMSINIECMDGDKIAENYVIRNTNEYNKLLDIRWQYFDCPDYELPEIDFNDHTLIGFVTKTGPSEIKRSVYRNDAEEKYFYNIDISITGIEEILIVRNNWLLIPRLEEKYSVIFDTTMIYNY